MSIENLPSITWRGLRVPWQSVTTDLKQAIVQHKYPDVAGARLEAMGREPLTIQGKALFSTGLVFEPSPYTKPLYPDVHNAFLKACADTSTGTLVHPTWGALRAKCESASSALEGAMRGGEVVACVFVEDSETDVVTTKQAPLASAVQNASALDSEMRALAIKNAAFKVPDGPSFGTMMRSIQSISDKATLLQKQVGGKIAEVQYRLGAVRDSVDRLRDTSASSVRTTLEKTQAAVYEVERTILVMKPTIVAETGTEMTIGEICRSYRLKVADFIRLNPTLARMVRIPAGTQVTRYAI